MSTPSVLAAFAHPDDIEFVAAGTLLHLKDAGYAIHYFNMCTGNCGSAEQSADEVRRIRRDEAMRAAKLLGATYYESFVDDLELMYEVEPLRRVAAVVRAAQPQIVLTHSPQDYMEDHMIASRLAVTAAFAKGMPNFPVEPHTDAFDGEVAVYHAMPHGLTDGMGQAIRPDFFVDTSRTHEMKRQALAEHKSQKEWLDRSQGMDSYLLTMDGLSHEVGLMSGRFEHAEGWRRHSHLGFSASGSFDPLREALNDLVCEA